MSLGATGRGRAWPALLFLCRVLAVLRLLRFKNLVGSQSPPFDKPVSNSKPRLILSEEPSHLSSKWQIQSRASA